MLGAPPVNWPRLALVALLLCLAILMQKAQVNSLGWAFDLGLTVLISSALFLYPLDLLFLELLALALLMWKPYLSWELVLLMLIPWGAFWGKKIFSADTWTQNLVFIGFGIAAFYILQSPAIFFDNWVLMLNNLVGCLLVGSILFFVFQNLYASSFD
jgi:hypothetical protein